MTDAATGEASGYVATVIESVILLAQRDAIVVGDFLAKFRAATKSSERQQPVTTFLEVGLGLAAIAQIWLWERAGLRPHLHVVDLPPAEEAWKELAHPETDDLAPYARLNAGSRLLKQVVASEGNVDPAGGLSRQGLPQRRGEDRDLDHDFGTEEPRLGNQANRSTLELTGNSQSRRGNGAHRSWQQA